MENTVKWNTMDSVPEESGKQYLVAHCYDNGSKTIDIATYYHEGDTAKLLLRNPKKCDKTGMDRLLNDNNKKKKKIRRSSECSLTKKVSHHTGQNYRFRNKKGVNSYENKDNNSCNFNCNNDASYSLSKFSYT